MVDKQKQMPLLEVKDFALSFRTFKKGLIETKLQMIHSLNMNIFKGEIVAVVGASGSGKSLLASAILGLLPEHAETSGGLYYKGEELTRRKQIELRGNEISLIPQSVNALDPLMKAEKQVQTGLKGKRKKEKQRVIFQKVGLPPETNKKYPFELSGGMARRVLAATTIISDANLIIADEPTPGLDPAILNETITLMKQLADRGKGIMFITHDIETALKVASRVVVMNAGETVETASVKSFSGEGEKLKKPYTRQLWNALPQNKFFNVNEVRGVNLTSFSEKDSLEVGRISFRYNRGPLLFKDFHLRIHPGEIVGLFGYSGSGKTTMAQVIAGYFKPKKGKVLVDGETNFQAGTHPVQLIWQHPEQAINPRWKMKKVLSECGELDHTLLNRMGIRREWMERWPSELSGGELQRFCIARALNKQTKYIIADEITTMLDAITQKELWKIMMETAKERHIGILAISHNIHLLRRISDRILDFEQIRFANTHSSNMNC